VKILITGTAGFIGYHLVKRLVQNKDNEIVGLDNINHYYDPQLKYARLKNTGINIENVQNNELISSLLYANYRFTKMDITDRTNINELYAMFRPEIVINLAAQVGVRYSIDNPHAYIESNIIGFLNILEGCRHYSVKHLIYASSSSVYGNSHKVPFSEDDKTDNPISLYAATKKSNELMACTYSNLYNIKSTGLRFFTVYGPWGRPDMAPMIFANAIIKGDAIKLFNNGNLKRDFTYIDDVIDNICNIIVTPQAQNILHDIYNIGCSDPIDIITFIQELENTMGKKGETIMYPMQLGDVFQTYANVNKIRKAYLHQTSNSLQKGIYEFVRWFQIYSQNSI
jgi:UDP-glucuronate 4-epimerase